MQIPTTPRICISVFLLCAGIILFPVYKHWVVTHIYADNEDYVRGGWVYAMALLASFGLIGVSFGFLAVSSVGAVAQPQAPKAKSLAIFDTLHAQREPVRRKLLLMGRASVVPTVGYLYAVTSLALFLALAPFELVNWNRSFGIPVRLLRPGIIQASTDRHATGLLVYVDRSGNLYLNSKHVTAEELPRALRAEFARRADWSVYVDGDSEAEYADVVRAMDLVRNASGSVIMLTPKMRAEAQRRRN